MESMLMKPRFEAMACFHKTQRYLMCQTLPLVAALDADELCSVAAGLAQLREMLRYCEQVLEYQQLFVAPLMKRQCLGGGAALAMRAEESMEQIDRLRECGVAVEQTSGERRAAMVLLMQRELAGYVAVSLNELARSEREINRVLWPAYSDAQLMRLEKDIFTSIGVDDLHCCMQWMIPALNGAERLRVLGLLQELAPPEVFRAVVAMSEDLLSQRDHERLLQRLACGREISWMPAL